MTASPRRQQVAICKPDHLGDLVLALPALRFLMSRGCELTLFIASKNFALARHFLPNVDLVALDMPYLARTEAPGSWTEVYKTLGRLRAFDKVFFLRRDAFLLPHHFLQWTDYAYFIEEREDLHQTILEKDALSPVFGDYDIEEFFFEGRRIHFDCSPGRVAFAIGAGFSTKKWSPLAWTELGHRLRDRGIEINLLSGLGEVDESRLIARAIGLDDQQDVFLGGSNFSELGDWLSTIDTVVAVDGGSAHLCSLYAPVLTIFGPSPHLRYAPTGAHNRMVTRSLSCSPCVGFDPRVLNACLSRECLYGIRPASVEQALFAPGFEPGATLTLDASMSTRLLFGVSAQATGPTKSIAGNVRRQATVSGQGAQA